MDTFNWLHLTDLHWGQKGQAHLWPEMRDLFFNDLSALHAKCGPWQVVLFSGDFVQKGDDFQQLEEKVLVPLWDKFAELGCDPVLLAVPGNHDLQRPDSDCHSHAEAVDMLLLPNGFQNISEKFWENAESGYRKVIDQAFAAYLEWYSAQPHCVNQHIEVGLLPGDFSTVFEIACGRRIGVVGLNTTFLQLGSGDYLKRLAWDQRQFHQACEPDGPAWVKQCDICLLMTHQGPEWLNPVSQTKIYSEINPAGRFAVHLFGHMHEEKMLSRSYHAGSMQRLWQGASLFGMEHYGNQQKEERRHGYSAGSLIFHDNYAVLRRWPRRATHDSVNGWRFVSDSEGCVLEDDEGTQGEKIKLREITSPAVVGGESNIVKQVKDKYLQNSILNKAEIFDSYSQYVDMFSSIPISEEQHLQDYQDFDDDQSEINSNDDFSCKKANSVEDTITTEQQLLIADEIINGLLSGSRKFIVLGSAGTGKTTLLRNITYRIASDHSRYFPIILSLQNNYLHFIKDGILKRLAIHIGINEKIVCELLSSGKLILLLDGFNEIKPSKIANICAHLGSFITDFPSSCVIITSRHKFDLEGHEKSFIVRQLQPLNKPQSIKLIYNKIDNIISEVQRKKNAERIWNNITSNNVFQGVLLTPFYLEILIDLFSSPKTDNYTSLGKIIRKFVIKVINRELRKEKIFDNHKMSCENTMIVQKMSAISFNMIHKDELDFQYEEICERFPDSQRSIWLCVNASLLENTFENDRYSLSFYHENIRDYFAAEYLINHPKKITDLVCTWDQVAKTSRENFNNNFVFKKERIGIIILSSELSINASKFLRTVQITSLSPEWREVLLLETRVASASKALSKYCALEGGENLFIQSVERNVRKAAALSLSKINSDNSQRELINLSKSQDTTTRIFATVALGKSSPNDAISKRLLTLIFDSNHRVASKALKIILEQKKSMSNILVDLIKCYSFGLKNNQNFSAIKSVIRKRLATQHNDNSKYLEPDESIYNELSAIINSDQNSAPPNDTAIALILSFGPAVKPPHLIADPAESYSGIFSNSPFPGTINSESFTSPVPCMPKRRGGIVNGESVKFLAKQFDDEKTWIVDEILKL